ncbi:MAG: hypothetical protein J1E39_02305 [Eubacterium sp.]|nr:hypothetical protein [Eubacterium sp.]
MELTKTRGELFLRNILRLAVSALGALMLLAVMMFVADVSADAAGISSCTVSSIPAKTYTGSAIKPTVTVKYNGKTLKLNTDYTVTYSNNTNVGTAKVTVKGKGSYSGTVTKTFTINPLNINAASLGSVAAKYYTGAAQKPVPTVKLGSKALKNNTDFTLSYSANTNVGTAKITVKGKGNFTGSRTMTFKIKTLSLSSAKLTVSDQYYTGAAVKPTVKVTYGSATYTLNKDYTVTYKNNTNLGTATVTVNGKGGLSGSKSVTFKIKELPVANAKITVSNVTYSGKAQTPTVKVTYGSTTYTLNKHYTVTYKNNTNAGTATVTVKGKSGISGSKSVTFKINPKSVASANVTVSSVTFTGAAQKPAPKVTLGGATLKSGTDYTVSYSSNTNAGTATVAIIGKGNYNGTVKKTFTINKRPISQAALSGSAQYSPDGVTGSITGKYFSYTLKSTDMSYKLPTSAGKHDVTVTGKGNFTGTKTVSVTVSAADISKATAEIIGSKGDYTAAVQYGSYTLTQGKDYNVSISQNDDTVTATVTGIGNYTGTLTVTKTVEETVDPDMFTAQTAVSIIYTGSPITPALTVKYDGKALRPGMDYVVSFKDNINVGTATVEVNGLNDYKDITKTVTFTITAAQISSASGSCDTVYFAGKALTPKPTLTYNGKTLTSGTDYLVTSYKDNDKVGTASVTVTGKGNFTGTKTISFEIKPSEISQRQKIKDRLTAMMAGEYGRQINSYWHSYKLGDYYNTMLDCPCTCHDFCNTGYEDGCTCLIGRSEVLGSGFSGIQCAGFAFEVFEYLFGGTNGTGENTLTRYGSDRGDWSVEGIKAAFTANLRPGDYLAYSNVKYGYDHYVIVYDVDDEGVWVYEANYGGRCKINLRRMTFKEFYEQTDDLYHRTPNNYELSEM